MTRNTLEIRRTGKRTAFRRIMAAVLLIMVLAMSSATAEKEFRPLPLDLTGGAPLDAVYSNRIMVYEDPTIRVERFAPTHDTTTLIQYYAVDIQVKDPSQVRTASADPASFTSSRLF